jgi:hypothetical protein
VACVVLAGGLGSGACGRAHPSGAAATTSSTEPSSAVGPAGSTPLRAPKTSVAEDGEFLTEVTEADPALATYEQQQGNVALRALLTDGSVFCAFLQRGGGIDNALVSVAVGARSTESQTRLPLSVTTFNTVEAVALLTLCPSYQVLLLAPDRSKIRALGDTLAKRHG